MQKIIFLISLLVFFVSCKQTPCKNTEEVKTLLGVWSTRFRYSEGEGYQDFPLTNQMSKVYTYEYIAFSEDGKAYIAIQNVDYSNSNIKLKKIKTFNFDAGKTSMKWIYENNNQEVDFLFQNGGLIVVLRSNDGKLSVYNYEKTKNVSLEDIKNAESI